MSAARVALITLALASSSVPALAARHRPAQRHQASAALTLDDARDMMRCSGFLAQISHDDIMMGGNLYGVTADKYSAVASNLLGGARRIMAAQGVRHDDADDMVHHDEALGSAFINVLTKMPEETAADLMKRQLAHCVNEGMIAKLQHAAQLPAPDFGNSDE